MLVLGPYPILEIWSSPLLPLLPSPFYNDSRVNGLKENTYRSQGDRTGAGRPIPKFCDLLLLLLYLICE